MGVNFLICSAKGHRVFLALSPLGDTSCTVNASVISGSAVLTKIQNANLITFIWTSSSSTRPREGYRQAAARCHVVVRARGRHGGRAQHGSPSAQPGRPAPPGAAAQQARHPHLVRQGVPDFHRRGFADGEPASFGHGGFRRIRAGADPRAAEGGNRACQVARSLPWPQESAGKRSGCRASPPRRRRRTEINACA